MNDASHARSTEQRALHQHRCDNPILERLNARDATTLLRSLHAAVRVLQKFADHRLDVFADVAGLRQGGAIADREGNRQTPGERLSEEGFAWKEPNCR